MANDVKKIPAVSFMTTGKVQEAAIYRVTTDDIRSYVAEMATAAFGRQVKTNWVNIAIIKDDASNVYNPEAKRNEFKYLTTVQIVIPKPFDLYDNKVEIPMIGRTVGDYSNQVVEFVRKFAKLNDKNGKRLKDAIKEQNDRYIILLSMPAILDQMFDTSGFYYNKAFNTSDRPVVLEAHGVVRANCYNERTGMFYFGNSRSADNTWCDADEFIEYFEVVKKYASATKARRMMPLTKARSITIY
jgi:hypothetical protein